MLNIIIFGAPGSGKGTQSAYLKEHYNLEHISTGDMLREEIKKGTSAGQQAQALISDGHLVPDELIIQMLDTRLDEIKGQDGVIFDGFPRTVVQARALEEMLQRRGTEVSVVPVLSVPEEELIQRIIERGKVSGRSDDNEEAARERLKVYHNDTEPVLEYFRTRGKLAIINGTGDVSDITKRLYEAIDSALSEGIH